MICCEVCEEWYHFRCISMTPQEASRITHYECARCGVDPQRGREESRKRKREDEERKSGRESSSSGGKQNGSAAAAAAALAAGGEKRVRRRDRSHGAEAAEAKAEEELWGGDGSGKWIRKDAAVNSESDQDEFVYMTSDDEDRDRGRQQHAASADSKVKQEEKEEEMMEEKDEESAFVAASHLPHSFTAFLSSLPSSSSSFRSHHYKQPRTSSVVPSFRRPDHRPHPGILHTPRPPPASRASAALLLSLSQRCSAMAHSLLRHPMLFYLSSPERELDSPSSLMHGVHRVLQRWCELLSEYDDEEKHRQMQMAAEEWRLQQLVLWRSDGSTSGQQDDGAAAAQPSPLDLLLSSTLPLGLGHPSLHRGHTDRGQHGQQPVA